LSVHAQHCQSHYLSTTPHIVYSACQNNIDGALGEKVIANGNSINYVAGTDGTITVLSEEWMAEDLNTGLQFPLRTLGPTHPLVQCLPTGVQIIVMIVLA